MMRLAGGLDAVWGRSITGERARKRKSRRGKPLRVWGGQERKDRSIGSSSRFHEVSVVIEAFGRLMTAIRIRARCPQWGQTSGGGSTDLIVISAAVLSSD